MSISQGSILSLFLCLLSGAVRCVAVRLLVLLPDFWWRRTYE
ncbi:hypothetical protein [Microcoleus sp. K5-D4]